MSIYAENKGGGGNFAPMAAGTYVARCYSMIHIGTIEDEYQGQKKTLNKVRLTWEFPTETKVFKEGEPERPFSISKEYTLSMHEKATLRKALESWRGKAFTEAEAKSFDVTKLLGVPCMISVVHKEAANGKTYAEVATISGMPKGLQCPPQFNPTFEWSWAEPNDVKWANIPEYLKEKMKRSKEFQAWDSIPLEDFKPAPKKEEDSLPF